MLEGVVVVNGRTIEILGEMEEETTLSEISEDLCMEEEEEEDFDTERGAMVEIGVRCWLDL